MPESNEEAARRIAGPCHRSGSADPCETQSHPCTNCERAFRFTVALATKDAERTAVERERDTERTWRIDADQRVHNLALQNITLTDDAYREFARANRAEARVRELKGERDEALEKARLFNEGLTYWEARYKSLFAERSKPQPSAVGRIAELESLLSDLLNEISDKEDVEDGSYGQPKPNIWIHLATRIRMFGIK